MKGTIMKAANDNHKTESTSNTILVLLVGAAIMLGSLAGFTAYANASTPEIEAIHICSGSVR